MTAAQRKDQCKSKVTSVRQMHRTFSRARLLSYNACMGSASMHMHAGYIHARHSSASQKQALLDQTTAGIVHRRSVPHSPASSLDLVDAQPIKC